MHAVDLLALADAHHLLHRAAALRHGCSRTAWYRAHECGLLEALHRCVSRVAVVPPTPRQPIAAALLAVGADAVASHRSAAELWGVELGIPAAIDVTVPRRPRQPMLSGVSLHRPTDVDDLRPVQRDRIAVTNPLRTCLDLGAVAPPDAVARAVEHFVIQRTFQLATLRAAMERHGRQGRAGIGALRQVLDEWALGDKPPDSVLEPAMARLLRSAGLPPAEFHRMVSTSGGRFELDFAYPVERVDLEVDGWLHHGGHASFEDDRRRDAYLIGAGWVVLRVTWFQVKRRPLWVAERVRTVLALRSAEGSR